MSFIQAKRWMEGQRRVFTFPNSDMITQKVVAVFFFFQTAVQERKEKGIRYIDTHTH